MKNRPKILVVLGPTATGKSELATQLAKKFNGEVISADSRQVYKGMNIGTGKVTKKEMRGVAHHLLNVRSPKKVFTVADYKKLATEATEKIVRKKKLPIICGGTGLYIQSIVDDLSIPDVPRNLQLRKRLEDKSVEELFEKLKKLDPRRARKIDSRNRVRLVRAIEITKTLGVVPKLRLKQNKNYEFLQIGLNLERENLREKIETRLLRRLKMGMVAEVKRLKKSGVSWSRLYDLGLEYRFVVSYLRGRITKKEMTNKLTTAINQSAKRQMTWFKRDKRVKWFDPKETGKIDSEAMRFLKNKN